MFKEFGNPFLEKGEELMLVDIMVDTVGKQLKQLVRIKRFAIEWWLEKPIREPINNYKLLDRWISIHEVAANLDL